MQDSPSAPTSMARETLIDRGRRCVFGYLCPMVLHETNNVLTVLSGIRQLLKTGKTMSDRIGPMIDGQLEKMEDLLGWIHGLGDDDPGAPLRTVDDLVKNVERLIALASKGRRQRIEVSGSDDTVPGPVGEAASLVILCSLLPLIPPRAPGVSFQIDLRAEMTSDRRLRVEAQMDPVPDDALEHPDLPLAALLAEGHRGKLAVSLDSANSTYSMQLELPADLAAV